jgi:hypothetical protein
VGRPILRAVPSSPSPRAVVVAILFALSTGGGASAQAYLVRQIYGPTGSYSGWSVAGLGDLDGDGTPEFAVGAPAAGLIAGNAVTGGGQVRVISGATGALLRVLNATGANDRFGASVANLGDVNGDGISDLAVGAPQNFLAITCYCWPSGPPPAIFGPGYARVFSGATGGVLYTLTGTTAGGFFGERVTGLGDVDGDAVPDLVVGAPQMTYWFSGGGIGYVQIFSGAKGAVLLTLPGGGGSGCGNFGIALAGLGDVDGDGAGDLIVGARTWSSPGCALVHSGASGLLLFAFAGSALAEGFGASVAGPGDLDGDGIPDLLVGAPGWSSAALLYAGRAQALSGASGNVLFQITGSAPYGYLGLPVAGAGDVDGDKTPDVVAGGEDQVIAASGGGGATIFALDEEALSLSTAGDQNGDGRDEVLLGYTSVYAGTIAPNGRAAVYSTTGVPSGSSLFGAGCAGSGGFVPAIGATGGAPDAGTGNAAFGIRLWRALGGTPALLLAGVSSQAWAGIPLPLDLSPFGLPGCSLLVSVEDSIATATSGAGPGAGSAEISIPVPTDAFLSGGLVFLQWFVVDPGPLPLPGAMSQGLELAIL